MTTQEAVPLIVIGIVGVVLFTGLGVVTGAVNPRLAQMTPWWLSVGTGVLVTCVFAWVTWVAKLTARWFL